MRVRRWLYVLGAAAAIAIAALVIAHVYDYFGSKLALLVTNGMWMVGSTGLLVSLVAIVFLQFGHHHES
jgi:Co/Zn/Cd efflux system component